MLPAVAFLKKGVPPLLIFPYKSPGMTKNQSDMQLKRLRYEQRHKRKKITFTLEEYKLLEKRQMQSGSANLNQFIKKCALETTISPDLDNVHILEMIRQIRKVGTNLNQIAHQLNAHFSGLTSDKIEKQIQEVKEVMQQIYKAYDRWTLR